MKSGNAGAAQRNPLRMEVSRAKLAKIAKFRQIALFPPLSKGGFLDCLACLGEKFLHFDSQGARKFAQVKNHRATNEEHVHEDRRIQSARLEMPPAVRF
jgi:hypothetical protein